MRHVMYICQKEGTTNIRVSGKNQTQKGKKANTRASRFQSQIKNCIRIHDPNTKLEQPVTTAYATDTVTERGLRWVK
jgi:hypothetical protein